MSMAHTKDFTERELIEELEERGYSVKYGRRMTFDDWWKNIGSGITPLPSNDIEEHAKRIAEFAWNDAAA